jgi:hypothetical protein
MYCKIKVRPSCEPSDGHVDTQLWADVHPSMFSLHEVSVDARRQVAHKVREGGRIHVEHDDDDVFYLFLQKQKSAQSYIPQGYFPPYEAV